MTKPVKWTCSQQRLRSAWASTQSSLCTQWVAKDPSFLHAESEVWSDWVDAQAYPSLCRAHMPFMTWLINFSEKKKKKQQQKKKQMSFEYSLYLELWLKTQATGSNKKICEYWVTLPYLNLVVFFFPHFLKNIKINYVISITSTEILVLPLYTKYMEK